MCSLQRLALSILLIGASLQLSASWPTRLTGSTVCDDLHVTHPGQNRVLSRGNVSLVLLKHGREVSCYEPDQEYQVEMRNNYHKKMMGVLWILDPVTGEFPLGPAPRNTKKDSVCNTDRPHISHYCEDQTNLAGCILGEDGMSLKVGYRAPSLNDLHTLVVFRYTVVFKEHEYLENQKQHFERCSDTTTTATAPESTTTVTSEPESPCSNEDSGNQVQPEDNNLTSLNGVEIDLTNDPNNSMQQCNTFEPRQGAHSVSGHCGIERVKSNESRPYTDPDTRIDYICTIQDEKKYARKITCESRCERDGQQNICRVKTRANRKRRFICHPTSDFPGFGNIFRDFVVEQQSQCECYQLSDVELTCPTTRPPVQCPTTTRTAPPPTIPTQNNRPY